MVAVDRTSSSLELCLASILNIEWKGSSSSSWGVAQTPKAPKAPELGTARHMPSLALSQLVVDISRYAIKTKRHSVTVGHRGRILTPEEEVG